MSLLPQASIRLHDLLEIAAHIGRQASRFDEKIVHANAEDCRRTLDKLVTRRIFLLALDARPIGRRDADPFGEVVETDTLIRSLRPYG